jgi:hypothetical protein
LLAATISVVTVRLTIKGLVNLPLRQAMGVAKSSANGL